jgi:hypothetical protein
VVDRGRVEERAVRDLRAEGSRQARERDERADRDGSTQRARAWALVMLTVTGAASTDRRRAG